MLDLNNSMPIQMHVFLLMFFFLNFCSNAFVFGANFCEYFWMKIYGYCLWMRSKIWSKTPINLFCISFEYFFFSLLPFKRIYKSKCDNYKTIIPVAVHVLNYERINSGFSLPNCKNNWTDIHLLQAWYTL